MADYVVMIDKQIGLNGTPISQKEVANMLNKYEKLKEDHYRLKRIVEAPWKCDVCGNYLCNSSACLDN